MTWRRLVVGFLIAAAGACQPALAADASAAQACYDAALDAESKMGLPRGLLLAIGQVESGRLDPAAGHPTAWPWTINTAGEGRLFGSLGDALTETRALLEHGITSVDVGCFQINLFHHPHAFASLEESFDPRANANYAARFLQELRTRTGSWEDAIAAYHSSTPERGEPYRDRVEAVLTHTAIQPSGVRRLVEQVMIWAPASGTAQMRIWTPSPIGAAPIVISIVHSSDRSQAKLPTVRTGFAPP
jgi:hypothetical protein